MKRLILFIALIAGMFSCASAQSTLHASQDTLTNTDTSYLTTPKLASAYQITTLQVNVTKISGTVGGTAIAQASLDGVNYSDISTDTLTLSNGNSSKIWALGTSAYLYYRIQVISSGTQSCKVKAYAWLK